MPAVAGSVGACRKYKDGDLAEILTGPDRRQKLDAKIKAGKKTAAIEFDKLDANRTGQIDLQQLKQILTKVNEGHQLDVAAWNFIVVSLTADSNSFAESSPNTDSVTSGHGGPGSQPSVNITQAAALLAVAKYSYYIAHNQDFDKIFKRFDKDKSGDWNRKELKRAMVFCENAKGMERSAAGMVLKIAVYDDDVSFVLEKLGFPANGRLDGSYVQQALATWHTRADGKYEEQAQCCCVVM